MPGQQLGIAKHYKKQGVAGKQDPPYDSSPGSGVHENPDMTEIIKIYG
jgi:hypothetical protein